MSWKSGSIPVAFQGTRALPGLRPGAVVGPVNEQRSLFKYPGVDTLPLVTELVIPRSRSDIFLNSHSYVSINVGLSYHRLTEMSMQRTLLS